MHRERSAGLVNVMKFPRERLLRIRGSAHARMISSILERRVYTAPFDRARLAVRWCVGGVRSRLRVRLFQPLSYLETKFTDGYRIGIHDLTTTLRCPHVTRKPGYERTKRMSLPRREAARSTENSTTGTGRHKRQPVPRRPI